MSNVLFWKQVVQFHPVKDEGRVTSAGGCNGTSMLVISGHGVTDGAGRWEMDFAQALCSLSSTPVDDDISFVATPMSDSAPQPVVVSAAHLGLATIVVQSWQLDGAPQPQVPFSWHCTVRSHGD